MCELQTSENPGMRAMRNSIDNCMDDKKILCVMRIGSFFFKDARGEIAGFSAHFFVIQISLPTPGGDSCEAKVSSLPNCH